MVLIYSCGHEGTIEVFGKVSVPLRGLWFLSVETMRDKFTEWLVFPSPCGDYGSYLVSTR